MNIIDKPIKEIIPYEKNPRRNDQAVKHVAESIRQFGFKQPIVIDKDGVIIAGHTRLKAAKQLHLKTVPVLIADDLTDEQVKAFRLADNKVAEMAEWDFDLLNEELNEILDIDMEDFGFELDDEPVKQDHGSYYGDERERTWNAYNLEDVDLSRCAKWDMPIIKATQHIPNDLISFNYVLNTEHFEKGVHFYIDDYQFERIWNDPHTYIEKLASYDCVLTPDFSLYTQMPLPMQMWNVYRNRLIGQMMQDIGIEVIPTLQWCREDSYEFCFEGLEQGGVVSVSTIGCKQKDGAKGLWYAGMKEAEKRLKPSHVIVYGGDIGYKFSCDVTYISNHNADRLKENSNK